MVSEFKINERHCVTSWAINCLVLSVVPRCRRFVPPPPPHLRNHCESHSRSIRTSKTTIITYPCSSALATFVARREKSFPSKSVSMHRGLAIPPISPIQPHPNTSASLCDLCGENRCRPSRPCNPTFLKDLLLCLICYVVH